MAKTLAISLRKTIAFAVVAFVLVLLFYFLSSILMPFALAALLAYLSNPLVNYLCRVGLTRTLSVSVVFFLLFFTIVLLIVLLIPLIQTQVAALINLFPDMIVWIQDKALPWIAQYSGIQGTEVAEFKTIIANNLSKAGTVASAVFQTALKSGKALFELIMALILVPVVTFYLLRDWNLLFASLKNLVPPSSRQQTVKIVKECDSVLSAFFRGQLLVMIILSIYYAIALNLIGLPIGIGIGLLTGILSIVPYLGSITGFTISIIAALMQYGTWHAIGLVIIAFVIGQSLENFILTPVLIGDRIGLHPVAVIFAVLAGGVLFGFFGVLMALPLAAVIMVLLRHLNRKYQSSVIYKT